MFRCGSEDVVPADPETVDDLRLRDLHQHPGARLRLQVIIPYPVTVPCDDNTISSSSTGLRPVSSSALEVLLKVMMMMMMMMMMMIMIMMMMILMIMVLLKGLPEMLLRQYEYEDPIVRGGKHLMHSTFFKVIIPYPV